MKKSFKYYILAWAVLVALFHVIVFVVPSEVAGESRYTGAFWVGYAVILVSFLGQLGCAFFAFKPEKASKVFLRLPIITESYIVLVTSVVAGAVCICAPFIPTWIGVVICVIAFGFSAISVIMAAATGEIISDSEDRIKEKTAFIKLLTVDAETLMARANTPETKTICRKVYEAVRYSDPMSSDALGVAEAEIAEKFQELKTAVSGNAEAAPSIAEELLLLITERNKKCKALK